MTKTILLQFDTDALPSTFDGVVAIDAGIEHLMPRGGVTVDNVTAMVHGAMFTRGGDDLRHTAIFIGGSDVAEAEAVAAAVKECFFGPVRVSVLQDASGCNTTAAAAVISAARHINYKDSLVCILGGTGPVGRRVAEMVAVEGGRVRLLSRNLDRAIEAAAAIIARIPGSEVTPMAAISADQMHDCLAGCQAVIACGAAGIVLLSEEILSAAEGLRVAIDLNAVPPVGIEGIAPTDKAVEVNGVFRYGALGVGGLKMKIHRASLRALFEKNNHFMDAQEVLTIGKSI